LEKLGKTDTFAQVCTDKKGGKNFAHLGPPATTVVVVMKKGVIEVRHAGKVKKRVRSGKTDHGCVSWRS
jgi:hypothetical protein